MVDDTAPAVCRRDAVGDEIFVHGKVAERRALGQPVAGSCRRSGAVIGLIQVMQRLENINEVGKGIAVAFVATIYGVALANLFFIPFAGKMRIRVRDNHRFREMIVEGVISILEGMNPRMLEVKLNGFIHTEDGKAKRAA